LEALPKKKAPKSVLLFSFIKRHSLIGRHFGDFMSVRASQREELHQENLAAIRAHLQQAIDDPRQSLSVEESRANFLAHVAASRLKAL
jgi:hypothetical protein